MYGDVFIFNNDRQQHFSPASSLIYSQGKIIEFPWSTVRNAKTWDARRDSAVLIKDDLHPEVL